MSSKFTIPQLLVLLPFLGLAIAAPAQKTTTKATSTTATATSTSAALGTGLPSGNLKPTCAPGGNIDLSKWTLQLPSGTKGHPDSVTGSKLAGCSGYTSKDYFYTNTDGSIVMKVPGGVSTGCVTTANSKHCRTELREASPSSWSPSSASNKLSATLQVVTADDSAHGTVIGQIHIDDSVSSKPVCELFYNSKGVLSMGVEQTRAGGNEIVTEVGSVTIGSKFSYVIAYEGGKLSVVINGGAAKTLDTYQLDSPKSYFKAGNYNQGNSKSEVHFFAIDVQH
ncbi:putative polysaccharide lyase family 7 protein [Botrytis cinerea BcDW1]|uniref:Polysaccharide Lyase family 7 protein n=2 Tax=Botryotinia fuckeliana TaxID=40559 RepID=G2YNP0_BOTF4|nr:putative polysaccharide lyase family 7 protein [Botrytis cinerea BcDW1]CCD53238.1 Polysaccharide Lyase family 7 protein [Botrytis cinerea T4]